MKNYIFIGLGPHSRKIYYPYLEKYRKKYNINIPLLIDLQDQKKIINTYLADKKLKPARILYLKPNQNNRLGGELDSLAKKSLNELTNKQKIDGIIITTEPKAHKIYLKWAFENNISVLVDKPLTSPIGAGVNIKAARQVYKDYMDVINWLEKSTSKCYVVVQRKGHDGYIHVWNYLNNFIKKYGIPISYIDSYFADGTWTLPNEFNKENHPYKYGYGKLMHSGYHSIDLLTWIAGINDQLKSKKPDKIRLYANKFSPNDFLFQINNKDYKKFFSQTGKIEQFFKKYSEKNYRNYGELDVFITAQFLKGSKVITTSTITLQQNSFSRRAWPDMPEDPYKKNGRLRHERQNIQVSNLLNIQIHTYQSYEARNKEAEQDTVKGLGHEHHFDVFFFRNAGLIGGKPLEKYHYGTKMLQKYKRDKYYMGHNEKGKDKVILNFIKGNPDNCELQYHDLTNKLLSKICEALAKLNQDKIPFVTFDI